MKLKIAAIPAALAVLIGTFFAVGVSAQTPPVTPEQVRAKFADMDIGTARALGYTLVSDCTVNPADGSVMGYHAYKPGTLDDKLDPFAPEVLLLLPKGNTLRVVGVEWEAIGSQPSPLLGQPFHSSQGHPGMWFAHYALHLYFEPGLQFVEFNPGLAGRCTPLPVVESAYALLADASGKQVGIVRLDETAAGVVEISLEASGLAPGVHAVHVHAVGSCVGPDFNSAGGHFNPFSRPHGIYHVPEGPHAGDIFGSGILAGADGGARWKDASDRFAISSGSDRLLDADGAAIVVHVGVDDQTTNPTGNAGGRLACGVVTAGKPAGGGIQPPRTGDAGLAD